ncbi:hypothetical protein AAHC03_024423 [Spirometra sp. Aus1]
MFEDEDVLQRIPRTFLIVGGILVAIQLISCKIVQLKPTGDNDSIDIPSESIDLQGDLPEALNVVPVEKKIRPPELFKMPDIYILWGIMFLSLLPLTLVTSATKVVGQMAIKDDKYLCSVATLGSVVNMVSRITWGPVGDKISFKVPLYINNLVYSILLVTFPFVITVPTTGRYLYAIWVMLMHSCIGGFFVLMPLAVSRTFGGKYFASNYGLLFTAFVPGGIIGAGIVVAITLEYHIRVIFIVCGFTSLFAFMGPVNTELVLSLRRGLTMLREIIATSAEELL